MSDETGKARFYTIDGGQPQIPVTPYVGKRRAKHRPNAGSQPDQTPLGRRGEPSTSSVSVGDVLTNERFEIDGWSCAVYVNEGGRKWAWYRGFQVFIDGSSDEELVPTSVLDDATLRAEASAAAAALMTLRAKVKRPELTAIAGGRINRSARRSPNLAAIVGGHPDVDVELAELLDEARAAHFARLRQPFAPLTEEESRAIEEHIGRWWSYNTIEVLELQAQLQEHHACWPGRFGSG